MSPEEAPGVKTVVSDEPRTLHGCTVWSGDGDETDGGEYRGFLGNREGVPPRVVYDCKTDFV